jgi:heat shock protein HslJ
MKSMSKKHIGITLLAVLILALLAACAGPAGPAPGVVELEGTRWVLDTLNGEPPVPGSEITLQFEDGNLGGSAGCNSYGGSYEATDGRLSIPEIVRTEMACLEPEGVMEQEDAYLAALQSAAIYRMVDGRLQVENAAGEPTLVFRTAE